MDKKRVSTKYQASKPSSMTCDWAKAIISKPGIKSDITLSRKKRIKQVSQRERAVRYRKRRPLNTAKIKKERDEAVQNEQAIIRVATLGKSYRLNLMNHCLICLSKTTVVSKETAQLHNNFLLESEEVPRMEEYSTTTTENNLLSVLNKTWGYLQEKGNWGWDTEDSNKQIVKFSSLPTMCRVCAENMGAIYKLLCALTNEINKVGGIIWESRSGREHACRMERFEHSLKSSGVEREVVDDTLYFLTKPEDDKPSLQSLNVDYVQTSPETPKNNNHTNFLNDNSNDTAAGKYNETKCDPDYVKEEYHSSSEMDDEDNTFPIEEDDVDPSPIFADTACLEVAMSLPPKQNITASIKGSRDDSNKNPDKKSTDLTEVTYVSTINPTTNIKMFTCIVDGCGKSYVNLMSGLKPHQRKEHKIGCDSPVMCKICHTMYNDENSLRRHAAKWHAGGKIKLISHICDLCKAKVPVKDMYDHLRAHVGEEYLIKCPSPGHCLMVFCTTQALSVHLRGNKTCRDAIPDKVLEFYKKPNYICDICGCKVANRVELRNHLHRSHEDGTERYPCPMKGCQQRFSVRQGVVLHLPLHVKRGAAKNGNNVQPCGLCQKKIKVEEMERHLTKIHRVENVIKCCQCQYLFACREDLIDHLFVHRHSSLFCDLCGEGGTSFSRHYDLRRHYFTVHQIGQRRSCQHCQKEFLCTQALEDHVNRLHAASEKKFSSDEITVKPAILPKKSFPCDECDTVCTKMIRLKSHKIKAHGAEPLCCKFCDEKFTSYDVRNRHEKEHQGMIPKVVIPCEVVGCERSFKKKVELKNHMALVHSRTREHVCESCGKAFKLKSYLTTHMKSVHMGLRPFICDVCGERFFGVGAMKRHKLIHTGERPFGCEQCGQRFQQKAALQRHLAAHEKKAQLAIKTKSTKR